MTLILTVSQFSFQTVMFLLYDVCVFKEHRSTALIGKGLGEKISRMS